MRFFKFFATLCLAMLITGSTFGAEKSGQFSISPMVGSYTFGNFFNRGSTTTLVNELKASFNLTDYIGLESNFAYAQTRRNNNHQSFFKYGGDVLFHLMPAGDFVPYLALGGGGFNFMEANRGVSTDIQSFIGGGGGIKYFLHENVALRMDGRINYVTSQTDYKQAELTVGLQIPFGGSKPASKLPETRKTDEAIHPEKTTYGTASSDILPSNGPSVRVAMPLEAAISVTIPPLSDQTSTVTINSAELLTDDSAKSSVLPTSNKIPQKLYAVPVVPTAPVRTTVIKDIVIGKNYIDILANGPLPAYKTLQLTGPERLSIDLPSSTNALSKKMIPVNRFGVSNIRIGSYPDSVRIVLDTTKIGFPRYRIEKRGNSLRIHFISKPSTKVRAKHAHKTIK